MQGYSVVYLYVYGLFLHVLQNNLEAIRYVEIGRCGFIILNIFLLFLYLERLLFKF